jgi:hypothetical protein
MNGQTWIGQAWIDNARTNRTRFARNQWHRWYAWYPVICHNASGGVAWGLTILRRRKRGQWEYRTRLGTAREARRRGLPPTSRDDH